jgi:glycine/D-amino acid oxidase-like deaminating enzyme
VANQRARNVLWLSSVTDVLPRPPLIGESSADIVIIGGGFLGASTALHLAERGLSVTLLEKEFLASGASGRNAGVVAPMFARSDPVDAISRLGEEAGGRLNGFIAGAGDLVFDLARRHSIDCDAEQTGFLQPAHAGIALASLQRRFEQWRQHGKRVELLDQAETEQMTGTKAFPGALLDLSGGQINPARFNLGLIEAAEKAGAQVHENSPALEIRKTVRGWRILTPQGSLTAKKVLLATNALVNGLWPKLKKSFLPLTVTQLATKPLDAETLKRILPGRQAATDTGRHPFSFRLDAQNRLISAAISSWPFGAENRLSSSICRRAARILRLPTVPEADFVWQGTAALTSDLLPRLHQPESDLYAAIGCNGRGIAVTTALGPVLAGLLAGDETPLPIDICDIKTIPAHALAQHAPRIYLPWARYRDKRETGRDKHI